MRRLPFCTLAARERLAAASHSLPSSPNERNGGDTIAIYHCSIKIVSRGKGKSAVAAAAYRSGEKLTNEWDGLTHDYTKKGGVVHSEILLPAHAARGMDELPTVHMGVAVSQMEKKGVATDKGEINRMIRKTNRIIREIRGYIDELREWLAEVFRKKKELQAAPRSPDIATLLTKYLSVERERSRKYSVSWQQKHSAAELQKISRAIVYLQAKGVATLDDLDAALSSVDGRAKALNESVKTKEGRMKKLQKLIEQGGHYNRFKPVHDELKTLKNGWGKKREKFEREHESDLIIWNAANRYLHANLPEGTRSLDIPGWQREYNELKAQTAAEYEELKAARSEVRELQQIRRCIDAAERCVQQEQASSLQNLKKQDMEL